MSIWKKITHRRCINYKRFLLWSFGMLLGLLTLDLIYVALLWPGTEALRSGSTPRSRVIAQFAEQNPDLPLRWKPISHQISSQQARVFIVAEDSRFYSHRGIDFQALIDAFIYNWNSGKIVVGASTITQQTAKNLFLSHERTILRKWHEALLSFALEHTLSKSEILRHYLNIAEFGLGIYGVEAAARQYFGRSFSHLSLQETAALAASLPSPKKHNPSTASRFFESRKQRILKRLRLVLPEAFPPVASPTDEGGLETVELLPEPLPHQSFLSNDSSPHPQASPNETPEDPSLAETDQDLPEESLDIPAESDQELNTGEQASDP